MSPHTHLEGGGGCLEVADAQRAATDVAKVVEERLNRPPPNLAGYAHGA